MKQKHVWWLCALVWGFLTAWEVTLDTPYLVDLAAWNLIFLASLIDGFRTMRDARAWLIVEDNHTPVTLLSHSAYRREMMRVGTVSCLLLVGVAVTLGWRLLVVPSFFGGALLIWANIRIDRIDLREIRALIAQERRLLDVIKADDNGGGD